MLPRDTSAPALNRRQVYYSDDGYQLSTGVIIAIVIIIILKICFWIFVCYRCSKRRSNRERNRAEAYDSLHPEPAPPYTRSPHNTFGQTDGYSAANTYGQNRGGAVELQQVSVQDKQVLHAEPYVGERELSHDAAKDPVSGVQEPVQSHTASHVVGGAPEVRYS